jgi:hypothetical protein
MVPVGANDTLAAVVATWAAAGLGLGPATARAVVAPAAAAPPPSSNRRRDSRLAVVAVLAVAAGVAVVGAAGGAGGGAPGAVATSVGGGGAGRGGATARGGGAGGGDAVANGGSSPEASVANERRSAVTPASKVWSCTPGSSCMTLFPPAGPERMVPRVRDGGPGWT